MSIRLMDRVWRESKYEGGALIVLLALADFSSDDSVCYPSIPTIAAKARLTDRRVQQIIRQFEADGVVSLVEMGGGRMPHRYQLHLSGEKISPVKPVSPQRWNGLHPSGEICGTAIRKNRHLTVNEPSGETRAKRATQFPDGFQPKESHHRLADQLGVNLVESFAAFTDHHLSKGSLFKDWDRALNTWLRNERRFSGNQNGRFNQSRSDARKASILAAIDRLRGGPSGADAAGIPAKD